ncbi:MAG: fimbrial protein [Candidatus Dactylopiibacterium carminicum]|uniref:Fimbrial protein n=1 Tax=Candidatus Dactylopiibacterium carminicum TaxID=857335 RepID=A0A272EQH2_9RHOO|nr:PilN domain-containing protein [Candidatus Dactylopiibacterium carminicum]KAF7598602.1 fimbrial protein [Candidatus Dactylopiibacterium carminicum]PAS92355.1 MAG: fimbrial protein [Candidatus Dactylopiibacterium carminicum]PAS95801.1 MAG: fimbrial protein [Candidatus Dactylopiibacterium carminicum]PAS98368.1 MAG: fimbrial protein [Candidatus Dactylopiibacterium carminicum]
MIRINLLPHREQSRKDRRQQFISLAILTVLVGGIVWFIGTTLIGSQIESQLKTNNFIKREIASLDKEIAEIARIKEQTQALLARKQVIESLQGNRTETVIMFNELVTQMPEGVFLKAVKQTGNSVLLNGYAQSNARVSQLMRNLDASPIFEKPALQEIKKISFKGRSVGEFALRIEIEHAPAETGTAAAAPAKTTKTGKGKS